MGSRGKDGQAYAELTTKLERMQREAGSVAVLGVFRPRFENVEYRNYPIIENVVPRLQQRIITFGWGGSEDWIRQHVTMVDDALNRYSGRLDEWHEQLLKDQSNPLVWFREGVRALLLTPAFLLRSLGLWPESWAAPPGTSSIFRFLSGLFALVALVAALVEIVSGWGDAMAQLREWGVPL